MSTRTALVEHLIARFPHIPREAVLKEDLLRTGIAFDVAGLSENETGDVKPKSYFIFSFDHRPLKELGEAALRRPPEEVALTGGPLELRRTTVSVRVNPESPYRIEAGPDGRLHLVLEQSPVADVELPPMPEYYRHRLSNGKSVMEIAPTIQWGYLIYLTVLRLCQYFGAKEECQFCDINHNWRQHKQAGRPYTGVKPVDEVIEALEIIDRFDTTRASHAYTLTGGSITSQVDGLGEAEFYGRYARAIEEAFPGRWIGKVVAQALPKEQAAVFKEHGIRIYHPNYEVWDEAIFARVSPGKERYVGRSQWHRRILDAREIFGARYVIPNFVAGVEMAKPYGFDGIDEAIRSTGEGLDYFMSRGVTPRFTTWCPEPTTPLGKANPDGAPLEYHVRLLEVYRETLEKYGHQAPPGYGPPGAGNAVFSVSSFMDVLAPDEEYEGDLPTGAAGMSTGGMACDGQSSASSAGL
ncbi:MAG: radical SAM protein [Gemmatimonas sp.]|nr:radical SAM protein [Gemmatimonas sp.]